MMNENVLNIVSRLNKGNTPSTEALSEVLKRIDFTLPPDYLGFIEEVNGAEGFVGDNYLQLWKAEELIELNDKYKVKEGAPGYFVFGSNLGGTAYAFDKQKKTVVSFEFLGMLIADEPNILAETFEGFLYYLLNEES